MSMERLTVRTENGHAYLVNVKPDEQVVCNVHEGGCGASSGYYDSEAKAIAAWNRQAEPERYSTHEVAVILAEAFKDDCACDFNGNDEWLPAVCDFANTACPNPAGVACWEQYLKHRPERSEG